MTVNEFQENLRKAGLCVASRDGKTLLFVGNVVGALTDTVTLQTEIPMNGRFTINELMQIVEAWDFRRIRRMCGE